MSATIVRRGPLGLEDSIPIGPIASAFDPIFLGIDEFGHPVYISMIYRNILIGGEPGAGKSSLVNNFVAHFGLSLDTRLCLLDGKRVELGLWKRIADVFVGPDIYHAIRVLLRLQKVMDNRYDYLDWCARRKVEPDDTFGVIACIIDEVAYFSATAGTNELRERFIELLRDIVARGRAVGIVVVAATQRPSSDIIDTSLRDLFAWRFAGRCTTDSSSDIILGRGWAAKGYTANTIPPENQGAGYLIAEEGIPRLIKAAYLSDTEIKTIAAFAAYIRRPGHLAAPISDGPVYAAVA